MGALDLPRFEELALRRRTEFAAAAPFPHVVIDDFIAPAVADAVVAEFGQLPDGWTYYHHVNEKKQGFNRLERMGPASRDLITELHSGGFVRALETLTGVSGLIADPDLDGGGLHETRPGGFLNMHADFLSHTTRRSWSRQLNLLLFLNRDWLESYKGWLEFWDADLRAPVQRITPIFNRCVIFRTSERSFHGVPAGVECPEGNSRKSIALYYFRDEGRPCDLHPTHYVPVSGDSPVKRALIRLDGWALHAYSALKRYTPIGDRVVSRLLRRF